LFIAASRLAHHILAIEKSGDWRKLEILVQNQSFEILSVHDLPQHLATAGEIMQQE